MRRLISRLPWWLRPFAWVAATPLLIIGWAANELFGQAKAGAKKAFAPLLWPAIAIVGFVVLYGALGPAMFTEYLKLLLVISIMFYGLKLILCGFSKPKKKRKK